MNPRMLKGIRIMRGHTQKSLGEATEINQPAYSMKERGDNPFYLDEVVKVIRELNMSAYEADAIFFDFQLTKNEKRRRGDIKLVG